MSSLSQYLEGHQASGCYNFARAFCHHVLSSSLADGPDSFQVCLQHGIPFLLWKLDGSLG